jgi:hypothetical protein
LFLFINNKNKLLFLIWIRKRGMEEMERREGEKQGEGGWGREERRGEEDGDGRRKRKGERGFKVQKGGKEEGHRFGSRV